MRKSYTYIIIGFLLTFLEISFNGINLLFNSIGYLLIFFGITEGIIHRPIKEFIQAKYLAVALGLYSLIHPVLFNNPFIPYSRIGIFLTLLVALTNLYLYYSLLKADYIWHPSHQTRYFLHTYLVLAIVCFITNCLMHLIPIVGLVTVALSFIRDLYLIYVLFKLRAKY